MKLIFCSRCRDVVRLFEHTRFCECGHIHGRYVDNLNAEISKEAIPVGFANMSFYRAMADQPEEGMGRNFDAFIIPKKVSSIKVLEG